MQLPSDPRTWTGEAAYLYHERAGICEYDGGMSRFEAEQQAEQEVRRALEGTQRTLDWQ